MLTQYDVETYMKDYQKARMHQREEEIKRLLSQPKSQRRSQMTFRLPKFILKWIQPQAAHKPMQECPEIA